VKRCMTLAAAVVVATLATAGDPTPAERLAALKKAHKEAETAFEKDREKLPTTREGRKQYAELFTAFDNAQAERFQAALDIAKADPKSDVALEALEWVLTIPRSYYKPAGKPAIELVTEHHAANPKVGKVMAWLGYYARQGESQKAMIFLARAVLDKNPDRTAKAQAAMALAWEAKLRYDLADYRKAPDSEKLATEAEKALEVVVKEYGDCPRLLREGMPKLGERAAMELFELRNLRVGKVAPEIEGEDLDGVKFKLSDYRGKVVLLDFWGDW
jgi:hypothetical protein